jgi:hypothetical protein
MGALCSRRSGLHGSGPLSTWEEESVLVCFKGMRLTERREDRRERGDKR